MIDANAGKSQIFCSLWKTRPMPLTLFNIIYSYWLVLQVGIDISVPDIDLTQISEILTASREGNCALFRFSSMCMSRVRTMHGAGALALLKMYVGTKNEFSRFAKYENSFLVPT